MLRPLIYGFSHIYGETGDIERQSAFWITKGMKLILALRLPVPDEKCKELLNNKNTNSVDLRYLSFQKDIYKFGIEFICHHSYKISTQCNSNSKLKLFLQSMERRKIIDIDGNCIIMAPELKFPVTVSAFTPDVRASASVLKTLGFECESLSHEEIEKIFALPLHKESVWIFHMLPFPQLALRVVLLEDKSRPLITKIDEIGWHGFSFLTPHLDFVAKHLPIRAYQSIALDNGSIRDIAFYNKNGLLIEFLEIVS